MLRMGRFGQDASIGVGMSENVDLSTDGSGEGSPPAKGRVPKATKAQLDAVRKSAEEVVEILDREQEESVSSLAQAMGEINEGEALAHLDTRLAFLERQVERLLARRDESDRGFQAELNVMRARVEDVLAAVGTTSDDQRAAISALEDRLGVQLSGQDAGSRDFVDAMRAELVELVNTAVMKLDKAEARIRGEMKAVEELSEERTRGVVEAVAEGKHMATETELKIDASLREAERKVADISSRVDAAIARVDQSFEERMEGERQLLDQRLDLHASEAETRLAAEVARLESRLDSDRREAEARTGESNADLRLEIHQLRGSVEETATRTAELVESARNDLIARVETSQERAAGAAIHLESMINQGKKQMKSFEEEWSGAVAQLAQELTSVKVRIEEVSSKLDSEQSRRTSDRGNVETHVRGLASKVDVVETRLGQIVEEVMAKQATRMEVLASQVANISQSDVAAEERSGAVEFLARRLAEVTERLEELSAKQNALGRSVSVPGRPSVQPAAPQMPDEIAQRLAVMESRMMAISSKPRQDAVTHGLASRLDSLERAFAQVRTAVGTGTSSDVEATVDGLKRMVEQLTARMRADSPPGELVARLDAIERSMAGLPSTLSARQSEIVARLDDLERRFGPQSSTILPEKKRRGLL